MQYIAYLILILNLLRPLSYICIHIVNTFVYELLNDFTCRCVWWLIPTFIYTLNKFSIHLFVAMRTRLSLRKGIKWSLSLKIGFALMTSDVLLLLFTPFNILMFGTMQYVNKRCVWTPTHWQNISVVGAWTVISDFTISLYCLFVFILPLRKLIQFERDVTNITKRTSTQQNGQEKVQSKATKNEIELMVQRIMFYSTIMLVTTMASYVVFIMHFSFGRMLFMHIHYTTLLICFSFLFLISSICCCFGLDVECVLCG